MDSYMGGSLVTNQSVSHQNIQKCHTIMEKLESEPSLSRSRKSDSLENKSFNLTTKNITENQKILSSRYNSNLQQLNIQKSDKIIKTIHNIRSLKIQSSNKNRSFHVSERKFEPFPSLSISGFK